MKQSLVILQLIIAFAILAILPACQPVSANGPRTLTGLVDAVEIDIASKIPGRVLDVKVREGQRVEKGEALVSIESEEILAKVAQVQAGIDAAQAQLDLARQGARKEEKHAVSKQLESAQQQVDVLKKTYDRMLGLKDKGVLPQQKFDEIDAKYNVAQDQLAMAQAKYEMVMKGARSEEIRALEAVVARAKSTLDEVESYQQEMQQNAPISGEVSDVIVHQGELAATGYPILTLVDIDNPWASFAVREDMLASIRVGSQIRVQIPALNKVITMEITLISPLGDFATWKATNDKNSFDLKSFEVRAVPIEPIEGLRPGMTARWTYGV